MNEEIFDPIRKAFVKKTPEEVVRQMFIEFLITKKKFPKASLVVEKSLQTLPFTAHVTSKMPLRRLDILCFDLEEQKPLLIVECKAGVITPRMMQQVHGYNAFIQAPFVVLVGSKGLFFSYFNSEKGEYEIMDWMPDYPELKQRMYV